MQGSQQGEVPRGIAQRTSLRQVADVLFIRLQFGVGRESQFFHAFGQAFAGQRLQFVEREPVILQAARQAFLGFITERADCPEPSRRVAGEDDDAVFITDEGFQARPLPALLHSFEAHFDHRDTDDLALPFQAVGQVVAGFAVGAADAVEASRLTAHGVLEVGAEGQVFAQVTVDIAPVTGGQYAASGVHHVNGPTAAAPVQAFEVIIDHLPVFGGWLGQQQ